MLLWRGTICVQGGPNIADTDGPGGPLIPNIDGPGGPLIGGTVSSMTVQWWCSSGRQKLGNGLKPANERFFLIRALEGHL